VTVKSGSTIDAVDTYFTKANVAVTQGATLNWDFAPATLHNVTLANGPRGSPRQT